MAKKTIDLKLVLFGEIFSACQNYGIEICEEDSVTDLFRKVVARWEPEKVAAAIRDAVQVNHDFIVELNQVILDRFDVLEKEKAAGAATSAEENL